MAGPREPANTPPTIPEIAALTARLRALSGAGADADPAELLSFLADKEDVIARIYAAQEEGKDSVVPRQPRISSFLETAPES